MKDFFKDFPEHSRVWIYASDKPFTLNAANELEPEFEAFGTQWVSHAQKLKAELRLLHDYFIVVMVDEDYRSPGGCSIDASVHFIKEIGKRYGMDLFDRMRVWYLADGRIQSIPVNEFANKLHACEFNAETVVINTLVQNKEELENHWMVPVKESWLKRYLKS